jgi:hypothetical protein
MRKNLLLAVLFISLAQVISFAQSSNGVVVRTIDSKNVVVKLDGKWEFEDKSSSTIETNLEAVTPRGILIIFKPDGTWESERKAEIFLTDKEFKQLEKTRLKELKKQEKAELQAVINQPATVTLKTTPELAGQKITNILNGQGFTMTDYQPSQVIFGASTTYKVVFVRQITDGLGEMLAAKVALGEIVDVDVRSVGIFIVCELGTDGQDAVVRFFSGYIGETTKGVRYYETTHTKRHRPMVEQIMKQVKQAFAF